jgi:hypothetical protein
VPRGTPSVRPTRAVRASLAIVTREGGNPSGFRDAPARRGVERGPKAGPVHFLIVSTAHPSGTVARSIASCRIPS